MNELKKIEAENPNLIIDDSPTQKIGSNINNKFKKYEHSSKMFSLNDIFSIEEFLKFNNQVYKVTNTIDNQYFAELKIDGLSISLIYENGVLITGATRGDGNIGED